MLVAGILFGMSYIYYKCNIVSARVEYSNSTSSSLKPDYPTTTLGSVGRRAAACLHWFLKIENIEVKKID